MMLKTDTVSYLRSRYRLYDTVSVMAFIAGIGYAALKNPITDGLWGLLKWTGSAVTYGFTFLCGTLAVMGLMSLIFWANAAFKFHGTPRIDLIRRMMQLRLISRHGVGSHYSFVGRNWAFLFAIGMGVLWYFLRSPLPLALGLVALTHALWGFVNDAIPPTVLYLAASRPESLSFQTRLMSEIGFHRVLSLIDIEVFSGEVPPIPERWTERKLICSFVGSDVFRLIQDRNWEEIVHELVELTPVIVLDSRWSSPGVEREALWLCRSEYLFKSYFVTNQQTESTLLDTIVETTASVSRPLLKLVGEEDMLSLLQRVVTASRKAEVSRLFEEARHRGPSNK